MPPPQQGLFAVPSTAQPSNAYSTGFSQYRPPDDSSRLKRNRSLRDFGEASLVRDELSQKAAELTTKLVATTLQLSTDPTEDRLYQIQLYPITLERAAKLNQASLDYEMAVYRADQAFEDETSRVEEEWSSGRSKVRERLIEGIEERRRKAREEKDSDPIINDLSLDAQARQHITRKLRGQLTTTTSPPQPSTPLPPLQPNAHTLRIEEIPSPFPLALTSMALPPTVSSNIPGSGRKKGGKGNGQSQNVVKGPYAILSLTEARDAEKDMDLSDIRRAAKRKRGANASNRI